MDVNFFVGALAAAVLVAFVQIVAQKAAAGLWRLTALIARGVWWLLVGWWVNRIRQFIVYGF